MTDSKKILCEICAHKDVCQYKDDYMVILKSVENATVSKPSSDGKKVSLKPISSFDFISDISVGCKHYQNWTMLYRSMDD